MRDIRGCRSITIEKYWQNKYVQKIGLVLSEKTRIYTISNEAYLSLKNNVEYNYTWWYF